MPRPFFERRFEQVQQGREPQRQQAANAVPLVSHSAGIPEGQAHWLAICGSKLFRVQVVTPRAIMRQLDGWRWFYVLRQKSDTGVWLWESKDWQAFGDHIQEPGQSTWLGSGYLTAKEIYPVNLLTHWEIGEKEPWCLATNLPDRRMCLRLYARRPWIEKMFGDFKKHGFELEQTMYG